MPLLPAFYKRVRSIGSTGGASGQEDLSTSIFALQKGRKEISDRSKSKASHGKDPFPISTQGDLMTRGYQELDELESGPRPEQTKNIWESQQPTKAIK